MAALGSAALPSLHEVIIMRKVVLAFLLFPSLAFAQQAATPSEQALQATVLDQVQALVAAHTQAASLRAQVADLQKQLVDAQTPKDASKK